LEKFHSNNYNFFAEELKVKDREYIKVGVHKCKKGKGKAIPLLA
jgi:hypothetical protein